MQDYSLDKMIKEELPGLKKNVPLAGYTTFKIGGPAKYFFTARSGEDAARAIRTAGKYRLPFFILGGGSNLLLSDKGFSGLVIKLQATDYKLQTTCLYAEAGVSFATLVRESGKRGLAGLEWAGGLPGTLGGAIRGNAGAFGGETKDSLLWVEALDKNLRLRKFTRAQCEFGYRTSVFKKRGWIILSAAVELKKGDKAKIQSVASDHIKSRKKRGPLEYPNAGSIFKNCELKKAPLKARERFAEVIKTDPFPVIPAAAVIAAAGLIGLRVGQAQVSAKHP
ncbi:MAG: UDP-N-acetylmuramate dehydrogenase, partial [bacterium]|nr:UDP-N-acetylmuramate dehydrogenase [bacterium]